MNDVSILIMSQSSTLVQSPSSEPLKGARAQKRAETRERLFEAALVEFREFGLAAAQVDRIAKAAGVVRGTFYFHFPSKDDVLLELARRISERIARRIQDLGGQSLREYLLRVNDACSDEHTRVGEAGLEADLVALYMRRPHDMNVSKEQNPPELVDELTSRFAEIEAASGVKMSMSKDLAAVVFMMSLFGIYVRIPPGEPRRIACEALIDVFASGLQPWSAETRPDSSGPSGS